MPHLFLYNCCFCPGWFSSRLDYANSVLIQQQSEKKSKLSILWKAHNLARVVLNRPTQQSNSRSLLQQLDWLPLEYRISFKIAQNHF